MLAQADGLFMLNSVVLRMNSARLHPWLNRSTQTGKHSRTAAGRGSEGSFPGRTLSLDSQYPILRANAQLTKQY